MKIQSFLCVILLFSAAASAQPPVSLSGIYPHLTMFNKQGECGIVAVVP